MLQVVCVVLLLCGDRVQFEGFNSCLKLKWGPIDFERSFRRDTFWQKTYYVKHFWHKEIIGSADSSLFTGKLYRGNKVNNLYAKKKRSSFS